MPNRKQWEPTANKSMEKQKRTLYPTGRGVQVAIKKILSKMCRKQNNRITFISLSDSVAQKLSGIVCALVKRKHFAYYFIFPQ